MKCNYANCRNDARIVPVISIPTLRTAGLVIPVLSPAALNQSLMGSMGLSVNIAIRQYEAALEDYKRHHTDMVNTLEPTYLLGEELCAFHAASYKFLDWFGADNWRDLCEGAREKGLMLDLRKITIDFKLAGWVPPTTHMELER